MGELQNLSLGDEITVRIVPGRDGKPIGRLQDGCIILFNQDSPYFRMLAPGQSVECRVTVLSENYVIVDPIREPEAAVIVHYPEEDVRDITKDLEKMIKKAKSENAQIVPKALLRIIRLEQLIIKILKGG
ncbi:unnamed protein product [marine sediment metagenome]|uniref:TRAM domain-containing protein n=1 Tax=marine sediment metagenome TaxID=412755 RepID=X1J933_9ZZZZ